LFQLAHSARAKAVRGANWTSRHISAAQSDLGGLLLHLSIWKSSGGVLSPDFGV
jgi:hypothetical protein